MPRRKSTADLDSPWKEILEQYFPEFLAFFFPPVYEAVDWTRGFEFMDKEFQKVVRATSSGRRLLDKLVKVWLKDGEDARIYVHVEIQGQYEKTFDQRMFVYYYRLFDRFPKRVVSLAVLSDDRPRWRPESFEHTLLGCEVSLRFPMVKLLDYKTRWDELERSRSPFAIVVQAHLKTLETRKKPQDRLHWKIKLVRALYEAGFQQQEVLNLFRFIDWVMTLSPELEEQFEADIKSYEEERKVPYVTNIERRGIEKGIEKGELKASREAIINALEARFQIVPKSIVSALLTLNDRAFLKKLQTEAILADSLQTFQIILNAIQASTKTDRV